MIGEAHLERLGSREQIARAKLEILSGLRENGLFVYNGDDPIIERLLAETPRPASMRRVRFGLSDDNDLYPTSVELQTAGMRFTTNEGTSFYIPMLGRHNVVNALSAIAVGRHFGVSDADIARGLSLFQPTGMRIERVTGVTGLTILNDAYNASPSSVRASVELFRDMSGFSQKFVVLGDMLELGEREDEYHRDIGRLLSPESFDYVFTYGPLAKRIAEAAEPAFAPGRVRWFERKEDIVKAIGALATPSDGVLVKGSRGMRLEDVVRELAALAI